MRCEVLRLDNVRVDYPTSAFIDINMNVFEGEILCVLVHNQRRSRCLTALLSGQVKHSAGQLYVQEREVSALTPETARRLGLYTIHSKPTLVPTLSIAENLFVSNDLFYPHGLFNPRLMEVSACEWMNATGITDMTPSTKVRELDIAQAHIIEILKALTLGGKIIVLDNVYTFYSDVQRAKLFSFLKHLKQSPLFDASLVLICDAYNKLWLLADRGAIIKHGRCISILPKESLNHDAIHTITNPPIKDSSIAAPVSNHTSASVMPVPIHVKTCRHTISLVSGSITALLDRHQSMRALNLPNFMRNSSSFPHFSLNGHAIAHRRMRKKDILILNCHEISDAIIESMNLCQNVMLLMEKPVYGFLGHENKRMMEFATRSIFDKLGAMDLFESFCTHKRLDGLSNSQRFTVFLSRFVVMQPQVLVIIDPQICFDEAQYARFVALMRNVCVQEIALAVISSTQDILLSVSDHYMTLDCM